MSKLITQPRIWAGVAIMMLFNMVAIVDRNMIALLVPEIRADLGINDAQIGLLQGGVFAIFYGTIGVWIGGVVDRYRRTGIIFAGVMIWSFAATATGLAASYVQALIARIAVGAGEGTISPAAQSLMASLFPRDKLALPMSLFVAAGLAGVGLAFGLGGWLVDRLTESPVGGILSGVAPWRQVLILTAAPGIALAFLALLIPEPRRKIAATGQLAGWKAFIALLRRHPQPFVRLLVGYGCTATVTYATLAWAPTYARRVLGLPATDVGLLLGVITVVGGVSSMALIGWLIDRAMARGQLDAPLRWYRWSALITLPLSVLGFTANDPNLFYIGIAAIQCLLCATLGPAMACLQMITPEALRGRMASIFVLMMAVGGVAAGSVLVGVLTEYVYRAPAMVGISIATVEILLLPLAIWLIWSARTSTVALIRQGEIPA